MPPLSYCFASFHPGDYDRYLDPIGRLRSLAFRSVTLVPAFVVRQPFEIGLDYTPPFATIRAVVMHCLALGMDVKFEPHLDWQSTLDTKGEWRGYMRLNPENEYFDRVIAPIREMAIAAKESYPERRISLTLGSEVDLCVSQFPEAWRRVRDRPDAAGIEVGHKLNHDASDAIYKTGYIASLDYVSFSFYPRLRFRRPMEWWVSPQPDHELEPLADAFERQAANLRRKLPPGPEFQIGEFGLGSADIEHPFKVDREFFLYFDADRRELRRKYYAGFLRFLSRAPALGSTTFWSAGYFDFLGVFDSRYKEESLIHLVREYNDEEANLLTDSSDSSGL